MSRFAIHRSILPARTSVRWAVSRAATVRAVAAAALLSAVVACGDDGPVANPPDGVATVEVTAPVSELVIGQTTTLQVVLKDADGRPLTGRTVQWSSTDAAVATVSQAGVVTALAEGTTRIRAASEGKQDEVRIDVAPPPAPVVDAVTLDVAVVVLDVGATRQLVATPRDAQGAPIEGLDVAWSVTGAGPVATVSTTGLVTALQMGTATVTAAVGGKHAQAAVTVLGDAPFDLVFERWADDGSGNRAALHRLDMRTPGAEPTQIQLAGSWDPTPSPDGTRIAFTCQHDGPAICIANADGTGLVVPVGFSQFDGILGDQPAWSPDGSRIAFRGWSPGGPPGIFNPADVWVMDADGTDMVKLTTAVRGEDAYASPAWSPELPGGGHRIAFVRESRGDDGHMRARIHSMRADGSDARPVTTAGEHVDAEPTWSPDGQTIAFVRTGGTAGGDIWIVNVAGGAERQLLPVGVEPDGAQRAPAWSPEGGVIAFASSHEIIGTYFAWQIYTVRVDGTHLVRHTDGRADTGNPAWIKR